MPAATLAWLVPGVLGLGGMVAQNVANKNTLAAQQNAQTGAQQNLQQAGQQALGNFNAYTQAHPGPLPPNMAPLQPPPQGGAPNFLGGGMVSGNGQFQPSPGSSMQGLMGLLGGMYGQGGAPPMPPWMTPPPPPSPAQFQPPPMAQSQGFGQGIGPNMFGGGGFGRAAAYGNLGSKFTR